MTQNRKLTVLNLCETARGGVGTYQRQSADLDQYGIEMHYLVPAQDAEVLGNGPRLNCFDRPRRGARAVATMLRRFRHLRRTIAPDLCIFHSSFALAGLAAMRMGGDRGPAIYMPHGWAAQAYPGNTHAGRVVRMIEGRLSGWADRVICVSNAERDLAHSLNYAGRFEVVENAAPEPRDDARRDLFDDEPGAIHLLFVGRLDYQKGFDILARAMRRAGRDDIRLHVVGAAVRGGTPEVPMPPGAVSAGWRGADEIDDWYCSADAVILPSRSEGLPLVLPEALRNGTPVLTSERSGMERLIERGVSGDHFPLDVEALADLLRRLDKQALRAMRPGARARYEDRFTMPRLLRDLAGVIRDVAPPQD